VSAPFRVDRLALYKDADKPDKFFRPAVRSLLVSQCDYCYEHDVRLSVCLSVCNVGGLSSHSATKSESRHMTG